MLITQERILEILKEAGVLLEGHFLLTSGRHSNKYLQCAKVFRNTKYSEELCSALAEQFRNDGVEEMCIRDRFETFGFQSGRTVDKFADCTPLRSDNGLVFLPRYINAFMSLKVEQYVDFGTHGMFICSITEARVISNAETMTYTYYQNNVKPKPQTEGKLSLIHICCKWSGYVLYFYRVGRGAGIDSRVFLQPYENAKHTGRQKLLFCREL